MVLPLGFDVKALIPQGFTGSPNYLGFLNNLMTLIICESLREIGEVACVTSAWSSRGQTLKSQIIQSCTSQRLRRKALKDSTTTVEALLAEARALEISEQQATDIESPGTANVVLPPKSETPDKTARCFNCGGSWPHDAKAGCPARSRKCNSCKKYSHYAQYCRSSQKGQPDRRGGKHPNGNKKRRR